MTSVHQCSKVVFPFLFLCFKNNILFCSSLYLSATQGSSPAFLIFFHCSLRIRNFHRLAHWNKIMHQIVMSTKIESFLCDVVVMISRKSRLQTLPCRFVSFHNKSILESMKYIPLNFLALSSFFVFSIAYSCFSCRPTRNLVWQLLGSLSSAPRTTYTLEEVSHSIT